jgi:hypothetical protein
MELFNSEPLWESCSFLLPSLFIECQPHSVRNACNGSMREARRAGR